ncbi:MAG: hypothetical protein ABIK38_03815 [candidate division WOR-3 bacterium]
MPEENRAQETDCKNGGKMKIVHKWRGPDIMGPVWFIGWLFTIGYLQLPFFWKGVLALVIWPYYLGRSLGQ